MACGNAFVLKPSEKDPSASLLLAELVQRAGFPDGVVNVVQGDAEAVDALLAHPDVDAVSFVGSTPVARHVYETGTRHGKRVQALGGAKNHMVVLPDADVDAAADAAISAGYGSAGERCMAISVVVAVGAVADPLVDAIAARIPDVVVGPGDDAGVDDGSAHHRRAPRPRPVLRRAAPPARVPGSWSTARPPRAGDGFFLGCSLLDDVEPGMRVYDDEIFGPVLSVVRVATFDEARRPGQRQPVRQRRRRCSPATAARPGASSARSRSAWSASTCRSRCPVAWHSFGGWKASLFGDAPDLRSRGHPLLHAAQGRHLPLARPRVERHRPRLPPRRLSTSRFSTAVSGVGAPETAVEIVGSVAGGRGRRPVSRRGPRRGRGG